MFRLSLDPKIFEETFNTLLTDKARTKFLLNMVKKGMEVPKSSVDSLVEKLGVSGEFRKAAELLTSFGRNDEAIDISLKGDLLHDAFHIATEAGMHEKAIEFALQIGYHSRAIDAAVQISPERAKEVVSFVFKNLDISDRIKASNLHRLAGLQGLFAVKEKIQNDYFAAVDQDDVESIRDAAKFAEDIDLKNKAAELYLQVGDFDAALKLGPDWEIRERINSVRVDKLVEEGKINEAAELSKESSDSERTSELYEQAGEFKKAAEVMSHKGKKRERVLDLYIKAEAFRDAAEFAKSNGMLREARIFAWRYVKSIDKKDSRHTLEYVAEFAKEMGLDRRAKKLYLEAMAYCEENGNFRGAKDVAEKAGMKEREELYKGLESLFESR